MTDKKYQLNPPMSQRYIPLPERESTLEKYATRIGFSLVVLGGLALGAYSWYNSDQAVKKWGDLQQTNPSLTERVIQHHAKEMSEKK